MEVTIDEERRRFLFKPGPDIGAHTVLLKLPSRRWMAASQTFVVPWTRLNALRLQEASSQLSLDRPVQSKLEELTARKGNGDKFPDWYAYKTRPMPQQIEAAHHAFATGTAALFMDMGTGKTKSAIDTLVAAFYAHKISAVVVVCPLTVSSVWKNEMATHCPCPHVVTYVRSNTPLHKIALSQDKLNVLVVGVESLSQGKAGENLLGFVRAHRPAMVVDESSDIKNHATIRTRAVIEMGKHAPMKMILSGTPVIKNIIDLYAQFEFLDPNIIGVGDYYAFRNRYCIMGGYKRKEIVGYDNIDELMGLINPYIYSCTKEQVMAYLPPKTYTVRTIQMSEAQKEAYTKIKKNKMEKVDVKNTLTKALRLQQVVGGYLGTGKKEDDNYFMEDTRELVELVPPEKNPKIAELVRIAEQDNRQMIVWARYKAEVEAITKMLRPLGRVVNMVGGMSIDEKEEVQRAFQAGEAKFFVGTQQAGGIGITLTAAHTVVYYSNTNSYRDRIQSEDRAHRKGLVHGVLYIDLLMDKTVDIGIITSIHEKRDLADYVADRLAQRQSVDKILEGDDNE